jgi:serine/threonine-protein phosphatase 2A activator
MEERLPGLLKEHLPPEVLGFGGTSPEGVLAIDELQAYLMGSFGSPQRLDYGTGHELSFLAFLGGVWKLGGFGRIYTGNEDRGIVLGLIEPYVYSNTIKSNRPCVSLISGSDCWCLCADICSSFAG